MQWHDTTGYTYHCTAMPCNNKVGLTPREERDAASCAHLMIVTMVVPTLPHLRQPLRPETDRRAAIRQTVRTKASVKSVRGLISSLVGIREVSPTVFEILTI